MDAPRTASSAPTSPPAHDAIDHPSIAAVGGELKLPPFWTKNPRALFSQVEARFALRHISSQLTKYLNVVSALPMEIADQVDYLLASPPPDKPYDRLKEAILSRSECTEQSRLRQLLSEEELGDRRPTQLLHRMKQLLGDSADTQPSTLRELFLQRLPQQVRLVLAGSDEVSLDNLAQLADRMIDYSAPSAPPFTRAENIAAISLSDPTLLALQAQVKELTDADAAMRADLSGRPRYRRSHSRRCPSPFRSPASQADLCYYHQKFGDRALKCTQPCSWTGNSGASR
ncbi:uncharacterized protein LOC135384302 [Ornithodoros turicata]|uniref:uncharacterized protein LOC135384302 n=1 Tax=Ornithodoros turicata TaxID=34597 RepID=UPI00313A4776